MKLNALVKHLQINRMFVNPVTRLERRVATPGCKTVLHAIRVTIWFLQDLVNLHALAVLLSTQITFANLAM